MDNVIHIPLGASMVNPCALCKEPLTEKIEHPGGSDWWTYDCPNCGRFRIVGSIADGEIGAKWSEEQGAKLSHSVWKMQKNSAEPMLDTYLIERILKANTNPDPFEQAANLLSYIGDAFKLGEARWLVPNHLRACMGALDVDGAAFVLRSLTEQGLIEGNVSQSMNAPLRVYGMLSFHGWQKFHELQRAANSSRKAFMAMKFGDTVLNNIVDLHFRAAVKATGFDLVRLDDAPGAGLIDDRLRVEIRTSRFLIADLTHQNNGAYWEAGFAEGLGKPVIYTCAENEFSNLHFDTNHHLTVKWDAENPANAVALLKATIRATLPEEAILIDS